MLRVGRCISTYLTFAKRKKVRDVEMSSDTSTLSTYSVCRARVSCRKFATFDPESRIHFQNGYFHECTTRNILETLFRNPTLPDEVGLDKYLHEFFPRDICPHDVIFDISRTCTSTHTYCIHLRDVHIIVPDYVYEYVHIS